MAAPVGRDESGFDDHRGTAPAKGAVAITTSDSDMAFPVKALYVGTAGTVKVDMVDGTTVSFVNAVGILPVRVKRVYATGTTALNIVGLF